MLGLALTFNKDKVVSAQIQSIVVLIADTVAFR